MGLPLVKLKAVYKFLEQLYVGGARCIMAVKNTKAPPHHIMEMIKEFSTVPEWIRELKRSACKQGAMSALTLAKAYHPEMQPALLADGFPELNADDSEFTEEDYLRCVRATRSAATKIADELDLSKFQVGYSEDGKRGSIQQPQPVELKPPRKQAFASDINTLDVLNKEMVFEALSAIQWLAESPQTNKADVVVTTEKPGESAHVDLASTSAGAEKTSLNSEDPNVRSQP
jgi:hypothetical protein